MMASSTSNGETNFTTLVDDLLGSTSDVEVSVRVHMTHVS